MKEIRYVLLADGPSDVALLPILTWLLTERCPDTAIQPDWADLSRLNRRPHSLSERVRYSLQLYPADLLFVHRDAEREPRENRVREIHSALNQLKEKVRSIPVVCVIPVRMQEAWLLFDEIALRHASGNPHGDTPLNLPSLARLEDLPDPKDLLHSLLRDASGLHGRRKRRFDVHHAARRVGEFIDSFAPLRALSAFAALEEELFPAVQELMKKAPSDSSPGSHLQTDYPHDTASDGAGVPSAS